MPTNSPLSYIKQGYGHHVYRDINNEDDKYKIIPSLLMNKLFISLNCQENVSKQQKAPLEPLPAGLVSQM